ncbi:MAG TPA: M48 family metallopeptidase, partial [Clostridia bacterium]
MDNEVKRCPKCKKEMTINPYYPEWCEKCDWNISPNFSKVETSSFDKIYFFLGSKIASGLFERVSNKGKKVSKIRFSRILAYVIAGAVQLTCILFIYLAILSWKVHFLQTAIFLVITYFSLPKFKKIKEVPLAENKYPTLYKIVNEIAAKLDSEKIDALYMDFEYNAFFKKGFMGEGLKMKTIICIGLPLFYILEPQEKVAVIAHEVAHNVNKDFTRSFFIQTARDTLFKWYTFFSPNTEFGGYASLVRMVFVVPRYLILVVWYILAFLLYRDSQISEYHADRLAAEVSGSDAYISAL